MVALWCTALAACSGPERETDEPRDPSPGAEAPTPIASAPPKGSGARPMIDDAPERLEISRAKLDKVLAAGPGRLLQQVPLEPAFAAGRKFVGFRMRSLWQNEPRVLRFGVQPGDVLLSLNGVRIVTPGDLALAFDKLKTAQKLVVQVFRGDQVLTFDWPIVQP